MSASEELYDNATWTKAAPRLSVLIPFKGDDPCKLLRALDREAALPIELVLLDDGSNDATLDAWVTVTLSELNLPARRVRLAGNEGRAKGRNRLARHARADHLLFLDSDMLPDSPIFLATWLALVDVEGPAVAFGGFSVEQAPADDAHALHRALAQRVDCLPAAERRLSPEKYVFTSNLLVRRDVFEAERFDEGFSGWGWEDVEWGMRVARRWPIVQFDNPATHLGLDDPQTLTAKYEQSVGNFARLVSAHLQVFSTYPSYRAAKVLKRAPLRGLWRPWLKRYALSALGPVAGRAFALRLYRAALYAEAL